MIVLYNLELEVHRIGDIDSIILAEKSGLVDCPVWSVRSGKMCSRYRIIGEMGADVIVKLFNVYYNSIVDDGSGKVCCMK